MGRNKEDDLSSSGYAGKFRTREEAAVARFREREEDTTARIRLKSRQDTHTVVRFALEEQLNLEAVGMISRVTWGGVAVNLALAILKVAAGYLGNSMALIADAAHTISDLATDAAVLICVRFWSAPADDDHPHGHGKIETLVTLGIGVSLAIVGLGLGYDAAKTLVGGLVVGDKDDVAVGMGAALAFSAAVISLIAKELLYRWTARWGKRLKSSALVANAWHHRSDALSSIPPALAIAGCAFGARLGYDLWFLDPLGALIVCFMLLQAAWEVAAPTLQALLDASADKDVYREIREIVLRTPGVRGTDRIRARYIGSKAVAVDLNIQVDGDLTVEDGHTIATLVRRAILRQSSSAVDVVVHVEPHAKNEKSNDKEQKTTD